MPATPDKLRYPPAHQRKQPSIAEVFKSPPPINPYIEPDYQGSGSEAIDEFISNRAALMGDPSKVLQGLAIAQQNVKNLDRESLRGYVDGLVSKAFNTMTVDAIDNYANVGQVDQAVEHVESLNKMKEEPDELMRLALAAPAYLAQFPDHSVAQEVGRRNYTALMVLVKMEQLGLADPSIWQTTKSLLGTAIPGRQVVQFGLSDFDLEQGVRNLHSMSSADFFKALPAEMDKVLKLSGGNPFYFQERIQSYLDPDDIGYLKAWLALDVIDAAALAKAIPKLFKVMNLVRATNTPIKLLRDVGEVRKAAELSVASAGDAAAAKAAKTTRADAAQNMSPFGGESIDPDITENLAPETQSIVAQIREAVMRAINPLHDQAFLIRRTAFTEKEIASANAKYLNQFAGKATVVEQLPDGFVAEVEIQTPGVWPTKATIEAKLIELADTKKALKQMRANAEARGGKEDVLTRKFQESIDETRDEINRFERIRDRIADRTEVAKSPEVQKITVKYVNNDFGDLEAIEYSKAIRFLNSPSTYIDQMLPDAVEMATLTDFDTARIIDRMLRARNGVVQKLTKSHRKALDSVLLEGDRNQVVWSNNDLVSGIRTPDGLVKFESAEQIGAYRASRDIFDTLYELKNREIRRTLELGNFKAVFLDKELNFVNPNRLISLDEIKGVKRIYNTNTNLIEDVGAIPPDSVLDQKIYKLKYPLDVEGEVVNYIVAKESKLKGIPKYPLAKRAGYVPKIDKNIFWVAEMVGPKIIDGVRVEGELTTVRFFDNPADANTFQVLQKTKGQNIKIRASREWLESSPTRREEFEANVFGGMYSSKRAEKTIPFGLEGTEAERMGGIEAMEAYMNHIAHRMPAVNFRAGLIQRFLNSAVDPETKKSFLSSPGDWRSDILPTASSKQRSGLLAMREWIKDQLRIPTTEERVWGTLSQKIAEITSRVPGAGPTLSKWSMQMGAKDLFTQLRGLSFHATLGWFNHSQFYVQAMGATLAMAQNPIKAPVYIARSIALRACMFGQSDEVIRVIAKAALQDEDKFLSMVKAYQKTGLHESTLSTGDYSALQGFPSGADGLRWLANKGLIFFKEGERVARNYAWIQAWDEIVGDSLNVTDKMIDEVTKRHLRYTLNLNRANRAWWQKGVLSIPTQFFQISAKFIEAILPKMLLKNPTGWTGKQKTNVMWMQLAMFGAAGLPFGDTMYSSLANWLKSDEEYGLAIKDPYALTMIQGGLTEMLMYGWTGERMNITNRVSIPAGIQQMVEILGDDTHDASDLAFGVTGSIGTRTWDAINMNSKILASCVSDDTVDASVAWEVLDNVAKVASSWRNLRKAMLWNDLHYVVDKNGNRIFPIDDKDNRALLFAQGMGVSPKDLDDYYRAKAFVKATEEDYRDAVAAVVEVSTRYYGDADILTNQTKQNRMKSEIQLNLRTFTKKERIEIMKRVDKKLSDNNYKLPEVMEKALDIMYNKEGNAPELETNVTLVEP